MAEPSTGRVAERFAVPLAARVADLPAPPPPRGPSAAPGVAVEAALAALARGETHYTDRPGIEGLRAAVARSLGAAGFEVDADHVVITCGLEEARFVAAQRLVGEGDAVAAADPDAVAGAVRLRGARLVALGEPARAVFAPASAGDNEAVSASAGDDGWRVLDATDAAGPLALAAGTERTVVIGSLGSGAGLASWRVGYLACAADAYGELRAFKQALTICTTNLSQWAALAWREMGREMR